MYSECKSFLRRMIYRYFSHSVWVVFSLNVNWWILIFVVFIRFSKISVFKIVFILPTEWITSQRALKCALRVQWIQLVFRRSETPPALVAKAQPSPKTSWWASQPVKEIQLWWPRRVTFSKFEFSNEKHWKPFLIFSNCWSVNSTAFGFV